MTNYGENRESPDAIKAEIERTRSQMSNKIDTLQERLNPDTLKVQAQEAVRGALQDGADAMKTYMQEHSTELRDAVIHAVKRNPLPTALIGIGVGWLLLEGLGSQKQSSSNQYDWSGGRDEYAPRRTQNDAAEYNDRYRSRLGPYAGSTDWADSSDAYGNADEGTNGHNRPIREKVQQAGSAVKEKASQALEQVQDAAGQVVGQVADKTQQAREQIGQLGSQVTDKAQDLSQQTRQQVGELTTQTQRQAHHMLEDNPLAVGAAALALGAFIGLLLPTTRRENEILGPYREQVVEKAQAVADTVAQRVQEVVQEVKPEVEQLANRVVEDLKPEVEQLGQKVVSDLKQTGQEAIAEATGSSATVKTSPEEDEPMISSENSSNFGQGWSAPASTQETTSAR